MKAFAILALLAAGVPAVVAAGPPSPSNVTVPVVVTNPATNPVNVAVVNGNAHQAVNASVSLDFTGGQTILDDVAYINDTDFPVLLTYVGVAAGQTFCQTWPAFLSVELIDTSNNRVGGPFGTAVALGDSFGGFCQYAGTLAGPIVVPPGAKVKVTVFRGGSTSGGYTVSPLLSGMVLD